MSSLFGANGPCYVNSDSNSTTLREHSWNNEVNMLFLDQPTKVGFSYDVLQNTTYDLNAHSQRPAQNSTPLVGTFGSQDGKGITRGTVSSAKAAWHFLQTFTQEFPAYRPNDSRISIAGQSYVSHTRSNWESY